MKYKIIFLLIIVVMLNGLNNSRELNDLAIVSAIGVEMSEDGKYTVSAQVLNTKKSGNSSSGGSSSDGAIVTVYSQTESTVQEAIRKMITISPKRLYLAHMELLIVSEEVVTKNSITDALDFFARDNEGSSGFILAIAKDSKPIEILETLTPIQTIPAQNIVESIKSTEKYQGTAIDKLLMEQMETHLSIGKEMVITSLSLSGDKGATDNEEDLAKTKVDTVVLIDELAYFNGDKFSGYLEGQDNMIYNLLENKVKSAIIATGRGEEKLVTEVIKSGCKMTPKIENEEYIVDISVEVTCNITEFGLKERVNTKEELEEAKSRVQEKLKNEIHTYVSNCQNVYNSDIIGFGNLFYKYKNSEFKKIQDTFYDDYFKNIKVNVNVEAKFPNEGGLIKTW